MAVNSSVFDIMGPIMVGPSSSHTAGACKIGNIARRMVDRNFNEVDFYLHGSFAKTYKGHGTNRALVGGVLGFEPDDDRIINSFDYADEQGIKYEFFETDLGDVHPNTVRIVFKYPDRTPLEVQGSSIGGGAIVITKINGNAIEYKATKPTLFMSYGEQKGVIAHVSGILFEYGYNIHMMKTIKDGNNVMLVCELDEPLKEGILEKIREGKDFTFLKYIG
ncbi:L-serine ammonia-lyase, iron-sulfur-dependent subunit beta [Anaerococcus murdochii]|uniref:L-serine deaminase n=1 Tax=Anaerococcus murdochii TaxID=411577 RepID=A0ABS7SY90_9FIRM|nr:L-serine ammonia-lyase, iron-sulfur-dependent subunit beta [Anaerococcus murdochii]MBZ2386508.1 L-serine ammonia-lyase, iron-sulfur-dependent subunit beta [Anaerococcus murdochii]